MGIEKAQFRNTTSGYQGAVIFDQEGKRNAIAVAPGDTVWMSEDEQVMTANAPRDPADNPFLEQEVLDDETREPTGEKRPVFELVQESRPITGGRPIGTRTDDETAGPEPAAKPATSRRRRSRRQSEETGAAEQAEGDAPEGEFAEGEAVGTPDAPAKKAAADKAKAAA